MSNFYYNHKFIRELINKYYILESVAYTQSDYNAAVLLADFKTGMKNARLTKNQQITINLRAKGYRQREIADKLEISQQGVNDHLSRAIKKICAELNNGGSE